MNEIICPNCKKAFQVDKAGFAEIVEQVRNEQFNEEVKKRLSLAEKDKENAIKIAEANIKNSLHEALSKKDIELAELKDKNNTELAGRLAEKETEISGMKSTIANAEITKKLEISEAIKLVEKECDSLKNTIKSNETERQLLEKVISDKFNNKLIAKEEIIKMKDDEIIRLKDFKQKLSTKMIGESLEQHCETEFNKLRATAFQDSYFEKDNKIISGTKGDYIYKENDEDGNEIISIMFEMKNENDGTATKKKNEDFFAKLDQDRKNKKCEYAILVSLLESESDLYNTGIIDVSYKFEKMYVVRPQFFITIITLIRNAAMSSMRYKSELNLIKNQDIDISNFEEKIDIFKESFAKNYDLASRKFKTAIDEIDKTIIHLQKTKDSLLSSENNLRIANNKSNDLTIKKLTYGNNTMKQMFEDNAKNNK